MGFASVSMPIKVSEMVGWEPLARLAQVRIPVWTGMYRKKSMGGGWAPTRVLNL